MTYFFRSFLASSSDILISISFSLFLISSKSIAPKMRGKRIQREGGREGGRKITKYAEINILNFVKKQALRDNAWSHHLCWSQRIERLSRVSAPDLHNNPETPPCPIYHLYSYHRFLLQSEKEREREKKRTCNLMHVL